MSDSGSFIEDDNHEQLTIQNIDPIKIMVDVEDDVKKQNEERIKQLEHDIKIKDEFISKLESNMSGRQEMEEKFLPTKASHDIDPLKIMVDVEDEVRKQAEERVQLLEHNVNMTTDNFEIPRVQEPKQDEKYSEHPNDCIKIMADIEDEVIKQTQEKIKRLELDIRIKEEIIMNLESRINEQSNMEENLLSSNHSQLADSIKIIVDVEDEVRRQTDGKIKQLEHEIKLKDDIINLLENKIAELPILEETILPSNYKEPLKKDENDNFHTGLNSLEQHLEGKGESSLVDSTCPKLLRLQSVQEQAKVEMKR